MEHRSKSFIFICAVVILIFGTKTKVTATTSTAGGSSGNVVPAYIWPLAYIYNQTLPVTPPMEVYGDVRQASGNGGLQFDGRTGWIDAGDFQGLLYMFFSSPT